jgi:hypothetical protein
VKYSPIPLHPGTIKYLKEKGIAVPAKADALIGWLTGCLFEKRRVELRESPWLLPFPIVAVTAWLPGGLELARRAGRGQPPLLVLPLEPANALRSITTIRWKTPPSGRSTAGCEGAHLHRRGALPEVRRRHGQNARRRAHGQTRGPYEVIEDMHMPTGDFVLRIGSPGVDHTVIWRGTRTNLSARAPHVAVQFSGRPVSLALSVLASGWRRTPRPKCVGIQRSWRWLTVKRHAMANRMLHDRTFHPKPWWPSPPKLCSSCAVSLSLYQLYTAGIAALTALVQRSIHLGAILALTFLLKPPFSSRPQGSLEPSGS